jgi:hypothetical protein
MEDWDSEAIWSDDATMALGVYRYYEGKDTATHVKKRNMESQIYLFPDVASGAAPRVILVCGNGWAGPLYLMGSRGYAIVHRKEKLPDLDEGMNETANYTAYKVSIDGGAVTALGERQYLSMISCDAAGQSAVTTGDVLTVIPSPDGSILAKLEMSVTCQGRSGTLTFLDAQTLGVLDGPIPIDANRDVNMLMNRSWSEDGRFMIAESAFQGPRGTSYAPGTAARDTGAIDYSCFYPATVSSAVNAQGIYLGINNGALSPQAMNGDAASGQTFGCDE